MLNSKHKRGFTIVELVVVIVLASILAATLIPRFLNTSVFNELAARDAIIATVRSAQQLALGREEVTFRMTMSGDDWIASANTGISPNPVTPVRVAAFPAAEVILETGSTGSSLSCGGDFSTPVESDFMVTFDGFGNAVELLNDSVTVAVNNGVRICVNDTVAFSVCISPAGYAHEGDCDD